MINPSTPSRSLLWPLVATLGWTTAALLSQALASIEVVEVAQPALRSEPQKRATTSSAVQAPPQPADTEERRALLLELAAQRKRHLQEMESLRAALEREQDRTAMLSRQMEVVRKKTWQLPPPATSPVRENKAAAKVKVSNGPKVQLIGSDAFITGSLKNTGSVGVDVGVELELLVDQRSYDRTYINLFVAAGSTVPFTYTFPTMLGDGTYSARARLEY